MVNIFDDNSYSDPSLKNWKSSTINSVYYNLKLDGTEINTEILKNQTLTLKFSTTNYRNMAYLGIFEQSL